VTGGIGWFAVNSVSGTFALSSLTHLPDVASLLIIVLIQIAVAFFGHNLVQAFERYAFPFLAIVFLIACFVSLSKADLGKAHGTGGVGGFLLMTAAVYGYAAGWNPYAADYARYLPRDVSSKSVALYAGLGLFVSTTFLEFVGAASSAAWDPNSNPTTAWISNMPTVIAKLTLLAIVVGSIAANVLNIYSGSLAFLTVGIKIKAHLRRAITATVFGVAGFFLAWSALKNPANNYENFLLIISYWLGPWLGVFLADQFLRKGRRVDGLLFSRSHENWIAPVIFLVALVVSVWLFSNQAKYTGPIPKAHPAVGDITFFIGFGISFLGYLALGRKARQVA
jgi:NCS1 family nucleobase:cation symporter-1